MCLSRGRILIFLSIYFHSLVPGILSISFSNISCDQYQKIFRQNAMRCVVFASILFAISHHWFRQCLVPMINKPFPEMILTKISEVTAPKHYLNHGRFGPLTLIYMSQDLNSSSPGQNGHQFTGNIFRCIFVNEKFRILITNFTKVCS